MQASDNIFISLCSLLVVPLQARTEKCQVLDIVISFVHGWWVLCRSAAICRFWILVIMSHFQLSLVVNYQRNASPEFCYQSVCVVDGFSCGKQCKSHISLLIIYCYVSAANRWCLGQHGLQNLIIICNEWFSHVAFHIRICISLCHFTPLIP